MLLSLVGTVFAAIMLFGCSLDSEVDVDRVDIVVLDQVLSVPADEESVIEVRFSNMVSQLDGYQYPDAIREFEGYPEVLELNLSNEIQHYSASFPFVEIEVLRVNGELI